MVAPPVWNDYKIKTPLPSDYRLLSNGIPMYEVCLGTQDVIKIEVIFFAGRWYETQPLVARTTSLMLREGTLRKQSPEIAELLDFYGATLRSDDGFDHIALSLYCLKRHLPHLLPLLAELITEPAFREHELKDHTARAKQRLSVDLEKVDIVAYRELTERLYGNKHPYGYNSNPESYDALTTDVLHEHFNSFYTAENCMIVVAGKSDEEVKSMINEYLGKSIASRTKPETPTHIIESHPDQIYHIQKASSTQTAIRLGKRLFTKDHPDTFGFGVLNTLYGGYYGSRLMSNLREDKGYTYGVYSALDMLKHDGYFYVGAEVSKEAGEDAVKEIYKEMDILCNDKPDEEELEMVRNYLLGNVLRALDGPFNISELVRENILFDRPHDDLDKFVDTIKHITGEEIRDLAQKYLQPNTFFQVTVG